MEGDGKVTGELCKIRLFIGFPKFSPFFVLIVSIRVTVKNIPRYNMSNRSYSEAIGLSTEEFSNMAR